MLVHEISIRRRKELDNSDDFLLHSWFRKEIKKHLKTSRTHCCFSYQDPKSAMLSHSQLFWEFFGCRRIQNLSQHIGFLYTEVLSFSRFDKLPKKARVVVYVIDPSSIRRVHFKAENIIVR